MLECMNVESVSACECVWVCGCPLSTVSQTTTNCGMCECEWVERAKWMNAGDGLERESERAKGRERESAKSVIFCICMFTVHLAICPSVQCVQCASVSRWPSLSCPWFGSFPTHTHIYTHPTTAHLAGTLHFSYDDEKKSVSVSIWSRFLFSAKHRAENGATWTNRACARFEIQNRKRTTLLKKKKSLCLTE